MKKNALKCPNQEINALKYYHSVKFVFKYKKVRIVFISFK